MSHCLFSVILFQPHTPQALYFLLSTRHEMNFTLHTDRKISHRVVNFMLTSGLWGKNNGNLSCLKWCGCIKDLRLQFTEISMITVVNMFMRNLRLFSPTFLYFVNVPAHPRFGPRGGAPPRHSGQEKGNKITPEKHVLRKLHTFHNLTRPGLPWDPSPSPL